MIIIKCKINNGIKHSSYVHNAYVYIGSKIKYSLSNPHLSLQILLVFPYLLLCFFPIWGSHVSPQSEITLSWRANRNQDKYNRKTISNLTGFTHVCTSTHTTRTHVRTYTYVQDILMHKHICLPQCSLYFWQYLERYPHYIPHVIIGERARHYTEVFNQEPRIIVCLLIMCVYIMYANFLRDYCIFVFVSL